MTFVEMNGLVFGACVFFASLSFAFVSKKSTKNSFLTFHSPLQQYQHIATVNKAKKAALIDLNLPNKRNQALQHLKNDEILAKVVSDSFHQYYICIHTDINTPKSLIFDYMSSLYSKIWNEAVLKNYLHIECCVVSDNLNAGLVTRSQILAHSDLQTLYTSGDVDLTSINSHRSLLGHGAIVSVDISGLTKSLEDTFASYDDKIVFFDTSCNQTIQHSEDLRHAAPATFKKVALGGTFDRIHNGHRKLLTLAAASCNGLLTVGIMSDEMLSKKSHAEAISTFSERRDNVRRFLKMVKPSLAVDLVELHDPFGPTISDKDMDAIIVSSETIAGAFKINAIRRERGMGEMSVLVTYRADSAVLSSSFIREKNFLAQHKIG